MGLPEAVARALRMRREQLGMTATELGKQLGIEPTAVTKVEKHPGRFGISLSALDRWASALSTTPSDVLVAAQRLRTEHHRKTLIREAAARVARH